MMPFSQDHPDVILASGSVARKTILENVGLPFTCIPADIDESVIRMRMEEQGASPSGIALELARAKALAVAERFPAAQVIGSDQILHCAGVLFEKAKNPVEARDKLLLLRGRTHALVSAVCVVQGGTLLWSHADTATLTMKSFDEAFLKAYVERAGEALTRAVGAYELEGLGAWLFDKVEGDFFTVLGMPLFPLLDFFEKRVFQ